jgi:YesN/AraC family two-component response regulator
MDSHPFRELIYVDSGEITVDAKNYSGKLCAGQLLIHKSEEEHSLYCPEDVAPNVIIVGFACDSSELDVFAAEPTTLSEDQIKMLAEVVREGREVFLPPYDIPNLKDMKKREDYLFGADQMIKLWMEMFLISLIRNTKKNTLAKANARTDQEVEAIRDYIEAHYMEKITLDDLCFLFGTNKTTICHKFKAMYGDTLVHYINRLRIKKAKRLMREGRMNLSELAPEVGFSSIHYFSKVFKFYENKSPSEYFDSIKAKLEI